MILDNDESINFSNPVSDQVLIEILNNKGTYPAYFIEVVKKEIDARELKIPSTVVSITKNEKVSLKRWITKNPKLSILTLITSILSGLIGFFIVIVSILFSINPGERKDRNRRWKYVSIALLIINILLILIGRQIIK